MGWEAHGLLHFWGTLSRQQPTEPLGLSLQGLRAPPQASCTGMTGIAVAPASQSPPGPIHREPRPRQGRLLRNKRRGREAQADEGWGGGARPLGA